MTRHSLAAAVLLAVMASGTACSDNSDGPSGGTMKLSGNCSITQRSLSPSRVISEAMVEKLLGSGEWRANRGLSISGSGTLETAYVGHCAITPADDENDERLRVEIVPKSQPQYADAQRTLDAGTGITKVDDHTYATADPSADGAGKRLDGAKGVTITPDYVLIVEIRHPADGVDAMKEAGPTVQAVADNLSHLG